MVKSMADLVQWQEKTIANVPETMTGAKIGWRMIDEEKGRGVFALRDFKKGEILEVAPVIPVAKRNLVESGEAPDGYLLQWDSETEDEEYCMPLGYVMMYNHSGEPNIWIECDTGEYKMSVIALRDIKKDEELCWDYSCEIWFDAE
jgi:SET domain-containing protein